jgi:imidazolonepropionase-like amidohydrolase
VKRSVLCFKNPCGSSVTTIAADGTITNVMDVHDNGRGPHGDATLRLAPDGTIASLELHGHHMMGTPIDETFSLQSGHAAWKSLEESGTREVTGPAFYLPLGETDLNTFLLAALLKAGGDLPLLPGGSAHLEKVGDFTATAAGATKHLVAYAITGIDLEPQYVWAQDDGTYFGEVSPWLSSLPEGWEGVEDALVARQLELRKASDQRTYDKLAHRAPAAGFALTHARVLDVEHGKWLADQTVVVVGGTIRAVGPFKTTKIPAGAETTDLGGKALLPGLWDMHSHLGLSDGALDIASGVTTARDVGNKTELLDDLKQRFDDAKAVGPHVLRAGFIEGRGPDAAHSDVTAETVDEAKAAVAYFAKRGYEQIKIYNSMKPELVPVLTAEAHAHGMTVTGHIPVHMLANEAVKAGYDGIEHVNMLFLNFLADHDTETRTTKRFSLVGEKGGDIDLKGKPMQDFFALLRAHHTVIDPTLGAFEDLLSGQPGKVTPGLENVVSRLPAHTQRGFLLNGLPASNVEQYQRSWANVIAMPKALLDAKIRVVAGTDGLAGLMLHHELALFVRGGMTTGEALRAGTIEAARAMKLEKKTGSIAVGKVADLVVVDGDPLANIQDVADVVTTYRAGVAFPSKELYDSVGVAPWKKP